MGNLSQRQFEYVQRGEVYEKMFMDATGATPRANKAEDFRHIDCHLDGYTVDVKGARSCQLKGYVLVELKNVAGKDGWCSKSGAQKIAFWFEDAWYLVRTMALLKLTQRCVIHSGYYSPDVIRSNGIVAENGLYRLLGRSGRKDVFTYLTKADLLSLDYEKYPH